MVIFMSWYQQFRACQYIKLKPGDEVYYLQPGTKDIKEYGVVFSVQKDKVYGWWGKTKEAVLGDVSNLRKIKFRPISSIAVGMLPKNFLDFLSKDHDLLHTLRESFVFIDNQLHNRKDLIEQYAQSMYQLDIPFPSLLDGVNSERIWMYDLNAPNLWWGEGKDKWQGGREDIIQGLPRYNPEYNDDSIGAFFTWWEPYTEPVPYEDLVNIQRAMGAYYYPGKYTDVGHRTI